ncbi:hypothetical protein GA0115255_120013 [Streptomyces sp. Ncost-T6T-2b]|nr:hypothetical protein GA0115255_120013 [Streptomyces sp. Ncost-T6T-2b]
MNSLNSTPYTSLRPTEPTVRFLTSGAAPMISLPLCFARSARDFRPYSSAVSLVTAKASAFSASPYGRIWRPFGRSIARAFCMVPSSVAVALVSR